MNTIRYFAAQQLSKPQMNHVKGGVNETFECVAFMSDGSKETYHVEAGSHVEAADIVHNQTGAGQVNCTKA